jgi:AAA-like domain/TIR domain
MTADVFVSYPRIDRDQVLAWVERLQAHGVSIWMDECGLDGAAIWQQEIVQAIEGCKLLLLWVSSASADSSNIHREVTLALEENKPILPLLLEPVPIPRALRYQLAGIQHIALFDGDPEEKLQAILRALQGRGVQAQVPREPDGQERGPSPAEPGSHPTAPAPPSLGVQPSSSTAALRVALLYKRHAHPDERLLELLERQLTAQGYQVFIDRHLAIGVEWAKEIERQVRSADAVIPLLSAASVQSEMLAYEVQIARDAALEQHGKPRLLPIRVNLADALPEPLGAILNPLQHAVWQSAEDDERVVNELLHALRDPPTARPTTTRGKLESVGGVVPLDSQFYVVRPTDEEFHASVAQQESIVLVKGARQMGKTSLLARGLQQAREAGARVVLTDFQLLNVTHLESIEALLKELGSWIADQLGLDVYPEAIWNERRGPSVNFQRYLQREVLGKIEAPLVWGLDEVDRLFTCSFGSEVFGMFRSWHNARYLDPTGPWRRLTLVIAYATEAHLFITDMNQSPFNVGVRITLSDFTSEQVADLNQRYGAPLRSSAEVAAFYRLVRGHPYLVRRGLHEMTAHGTELDAFQAQADRDEGIYGDHLRRILVLLVKDPELCGAVRAVLRGEPCPSPEAFYRLQSAGVLTGESLRDARPRCQLYASYLERHLL